LVAIDQTSEYHDNTSMYSIEKLQTPRLILQKGNRAVAERDNGLTGSESIGGIKNEQLNFSQKTLK